MKLNETVNNGLIGMTIGAIGGAAYGVYNGLYKFASSVPDCMWSKMHRGMEMGVWGTMQISKEKLLQGPTLYTALVDHVKNEFQLVMNLEDEATKSALSKSLNKIVTGVIIGAAVGALVGIVCKAVHNHFQKKPDNA